LNPKPVNAENAKKNAALKAVRHVKDEMIVGLGSGSTAAYAIEEIGKRMKKEKINVLGIPTSYQSFILAVKNGIPTTTMEEHPILDLSIDGADQIDRNLNLIKGMGGALTREKIIACASNYNIIIADESKKTNILGANGQPVPVEILPLALPLVDRNVRKMRGKPVLREGKGKVGPVVTDNGNVILDVDFGPIEKPAELASELKALSGVVETGLFVGLANLVYIGTSSGIEKLVKG
jgi:ribose 5-phosphate isomerase A